MPAAAPASAPSGSSRSALHRELLGRLRGTGPRGTLLRAPRGWGKAEILSSLTRDLMDSGSCPIEIDVASCAVSPGEFACTVAAAALESILSPGASGVTEMTGAPPPEARLRALAGSSALAADGESAEAASEVLALLESGSGGGAALVRAALRTLQRVAARPGPPAILVAHAVDGAVRLAPYPGLRGVLTHVTQAMAAGGLRFVASIAPEGRASSLLAGLQRTLGSDLSVLDLPPLDPEEIRALAAAHDIPADEAERLRAATGGRLLTLRLLLPWMAEGLLAEGLPFDRALAREMEPDRGRIFHELRFDYHMLIERTRGHASCRAILNVLAREEGLDLSGIASRLRRSAGSTLDYLKWLTEVALVGREGRRYRFADPLLRLYVLLHEVPERPRDAAGRAAAVRRFVTGLDAPPLPLRPVGRPRGVKRAAAGASTPRDERPRAASRDGSRREPPPAVRRDDLIEID